MAEESKVSLAQRKQELLAESEMLRQRLAADLNVIQGTFSWVPRTAKIARTIGRILLFAAPVAGAFFAKKNAKESNRSKQAKNGFLSKALLGLEVFSQIQPIIQALHAPRRRSETRREDEG